MHFRRPAAIGMMTLLLTATNAVAAQQDMTVVTLRSGHSTIIQTPGLTRVAVGDSKIAGVVTVGNSEIIINGKSPGQTNLFVWQGQRRAAYELNVSEQTLDDVAAMVRSAIPISGANVISFGHSIVINGSVDTPEAADRIAQVVQQFQADAKENKYTIVNAVRLTKPFGNLSSSLQAIRGAGGVTVDRDAKGNLVVSGRVPDRVVAQQVLESVRSIGGAQLPNDAKVVDRLTVETNSQVDVKVYILEVDRTAMQQLGVRLQSGTPDPNHPGFYILGQPNFPVQETPQTAGHAFNVGSFYRTVILTPTLDLVLQSGHARLLSAPDLVTMPGAEATFLVGGEIPIPFASGLGQISIVYKEFGVRLQLTPTILGDGGVETKIRPEVSQLDYANAVQISGFLIPAFKVSRIATDVITNAGESIVMAGLLKRDEQRTITKIPLLGDIPVLGKLFRSTAYQKQDTDVVFVMTPQILTR